MKAFIIILLSVALVQSRIFQDTGKVQNIDLDKEVGATLLALTEEIDYTFDYVVKNAYGIDYAAFLFGSNVKETGKGNQIHLHVDTSFKSIVMADETKLGYGMDCSTTGTDCTLKSGAAYAACVATVTDFKTWKSDTTDSQAFYPKDSECIAAQTFMRWNNDTIDNSDTYATNLPITLINSNTTSTIEAGLLGLSPDGDFFNYIKKATDWGKDTTDVLFGLSMTPNSEGSNLMSMAKADLWKSNQFVIHGKRNGGDIPFYSELADGLSSWQVAGTNFTLTDDTTSTYTPTENQKLCVSTQYPLMLGFTDPTVANTITKYVKKVCDDANNCTVDNAKPDNIKDMTVGILNGPDPTAKGADGYKLTLKVADVLNYDADAKKLTPLVGGLVVPATFGCPVDTNIVVGRAFLSKYEAVMKIEKTKTSVGFVANEGTSSVFLIILIILGCIILAICIAIILLKVCKRKTEGNDGYERAE